ncbi:MAG: MarR family winged helix-turn-helix transcriptional regulator [Sphingorhabdus sp.]|uniref:MarR family winged helix-turn-helix transcriptional regulator n=1 Tax=Sphingorhabdus sp. TaxID=1902408 RepID=UPI0038FC5214
MRHDSNFEIAHDISRNFAAIYHRCHPRYTIALSHQSVRVLQLLHEERAVQVQRVAEFLGCAANTASELISRMVSKGLIEKQRSEADERVVRLCLTDAGTAAFDEHVGLDVLRLARALALGDDQAANDIQTAFAKLLNLIETAK